MMFNLIMKNVTKEKKVSHLTCFEMVVFRFYLIHMSGSLCFVRTERWLLHQELHFKLV